MDREELHRMISEDELCKASVLVFANKQDLPNAMGVAELTDKLGLHTLRDREWYIQASCATSGEGLCEGLEWLSTSINKEPPAPEAAAGAAGSERRWWPCFRRGDSTDQGTDQTASEPPVSGGLADRTCDCGRVNTCARLSSLAHAWNGPLRIFRRSAIFHARFMSDARL